MKKLLGLCIVMMSLQALAAEKSNVLCSGSKGEVSIAIEDHCLAIAVKDLVEGTSHTFRTCDHQSENLDLTVENLRSGQWEKYHSSAMEVPRVGQISYNIHFWLLDPYYSGHWKLVSLSTSKIGFGYPVNNEYQLPDYLQGMKCKSQK